DGADMTPCVIAGPTCDSADVLYEKMPYPLPVTLEIGDKLLIEGTGAYTSTYSSVAFNGIPPLKTYPISPASFRGPTSRAPVPRLPPRTLPDLTTLPAARPAPLAVGTDVP